MPALVNAETSLGLPGPRDERTRELTPRFTVSTELDPDDPAFARALSEGVAVAYVAPGTNNVISGFGAIVTHDGERFRVTDDRAALAVAVTDDPTGGNRPPRRRGPGSIYYRRPTTRMGVIWMLRRALFGAAGDEADPDVAEVRRVLREGTPLRFTSRRDEDIRAACRVAREFGLTGFTVVQAYDAARAADVLRERGARVVLPPPFFSESGYGLDRSRVRLGAAADLEAAGVPFAISADGDGTGLRAAAALWHRFGLGRDAALAAITSRAAATLGIAERAGSIGPGRRADLVFFDGDPLEPTSRVVRVMVAGKTVYEDQE
jgi:imidazolonepropionase-like amidohydrolase